MEHTKKLLYQPEAMMKLKNEEKLSRHQAWESELEVGSQGRVGRWEVAGVGGVSSPRPPPLPNSGAGDPEASGGRGGGACADHLHLRHQAQREEQGVSGGHGEPCSLAQALAFPGPLPQPHPLTSRVLRMIRDSSGKPCIGDEVIDTMVVVLAAELTISMGHPKEHSGCKPGLPHFQGLWPSQDLYYTRKE